MGRKRKAPKKGGPSKGSADDGDEFLFPLRWRKKCPRNKFTIADDVTLQKILMGNPRPQPEFQGKEYVFGVKSEDKLVFRCDEPNCTSAFTTQPALNTHKLKHLNRKLKCEFCTMTFKNEEDMTKHLDEFHPDLEKYPEANPLQCKKCGKVPRDKMALWRHVRESHRGPPVPCPHCGVLFRRPDNMKEHIKYKHPPEGTPARTYSCEICEQQFNYKSAMRIHIRRAHRGQVENFRCVICDSNYSCRESYQNHMRRNHVSPTFHPCVICDVKFLDRSHLNRHFRSSAHKTAARNKTTPMMDDLDEKPDVKNIKLNSDQTPMTKEELVASCRQKLVKIILHRVDERKCRYNFSGNPTPKRAIDDHLFKCVYCSKMLPNLEAVTTHEAICYMKIRSRKLHICPHCNKEFQKAFTLKLHMRSHSDERPFPCSFCDSKFKSSHIKMQHEKAIHFGIRQRPQETRTFICNYDGCGRSYSCGRSLQKHVKVHHRGILWKCEICGQKFKADHHYRCHVRDFHSETTTLLMCHPCKRTYKSRRSMLVHFTTERHKRKAKEFDRNQGSKEETTEVLLEESHPPSSPPNQEDEADEGQIDDENGVVKNELEN